MNTDLIWYWIENRFAGTVESVQLVNQRANSAKEPLICP